MEPMLSKYLHARGRTLGLPISGTFELTPRCNFHCRMCYVHLTAEEQRSRGAELSAERWLALAEEAKRAGTVFLLLTGGEPLVRPDFPEIYREIQKMGFILSLNTNGYYLQGELRELLRSAPPSRVNISLYGADNATYERLCGVPAYDRVSENIRALRAAGIDVRVTMLLTPENCGELSRVLDEAKAVGAHAVAASYLFPPLRAHPERVGENFRLSPEEAARFSVAFNRRAMPPEAFARHAETLLTGTAVEREGDDCGPTEGEGLGCRAGTTSFWLSWDGKLLPCGQMTEPAVECHSLAAAWDELRGRVARLRLPPECTGCAVRNACQVCAAKCLCETGHIDGKPDYVCRMGRAYLAALRAARGKEDEHGHQA